MNLDPDVEAILVGLESESWVQRQKAMEHLELIQDVKKVYEVFDILSSSPNVIIWTLFLQNITRFKLEHQLFVINKLLDTQSALKNVIFQAVLKLPDSYGMILCFNLLKKTENTDYIVEVFKYFSEKKSAKCVVPLLEFYTTPIAKKLHIELFELMRAIPDVRFSNLLIRIVKSPDLNTEEVIAALKTLSSYTIHFGIPSRIFKHFFKQSNTELRLISLHALASFNKFKYVKRLIPTQKDEVDHEVRRSLLLLCGTYPTGKNISILLEVIENSSNSAELIRTAKSVLESIPLSDKQATLHKQVYKSSKKTKALIVSEIARERDPKDQKFFEKILATDSNMIVKAACVQALSSLGDAIIDRKMLKLMDEGEELANSVVIGLSQKFYLGKGDIFLELLKTRNEGFEIVLQSILSVLPKYFKMYSPSDELSQYLLYLTHFDNMNIRILSIQALGASRINSYALVLIESFLEEENNFIKKEFLKAIASLVEDKVMFLSEVYKKYHETTDLTHEMIEVLTFTTTEQLEFYQAILKSDPSRQSLIKLIETSDPEKSRDSFLSLILEDFNLPLDVLASLCGQLIQSERALNESDSQRLMQYFVHAGLQEKEWILPLLARVKHHHLELLKLFGKAEESLKDAFHDVLMKQCRKSNG